MKQIEDMKYIDADKLIAEIDKKWKELADKNVKIGGGKYDIEISTYLLIKNIITSLQQEQPEVDLEKEIDAYLQDWEDDEEIGIHLSTDFGDMPIEVDDIRDLARHFFELGLNSKK